MPLFRQTYKDARVPFFFVVLEKLPFPLLRHVANCGQDGQHPGDPSRGVEELADTKLCRPSTTKLDACFCDVLAGCFDDTGMGSLLLANKASSWTFWIR